MRAPLERRDFRTHLEVAWIERRRGIGVLRMHRQNMNGRVMRGQMLNWSGSRS